MIIFRFNDLFGKQVFVLVIYHGTKIIGGFGLIG